MKKYLFLLLLSFPLIANAQRGGRSRPVRPVERSERPGERNHGSENDRYTRREEHLSSAELQSYIYPSNITASSNGRIAVGEHYLRWKLFRQRYPVTFLKLSLTSNLFEVVYENGQFLFLHCGEMVMGKFSISRENNEVTINSTETNPDKKIELIFDEHFWRQGIRINADNAVLKIAASNGRAYDIEPVAAKDNHFFYIAKITDDVWFDVSKGGIDKAIPHLEEFYDKSRIKIFSLVTDFKTNDLLKRNSFSQSVFLKKKKALIDNLNSLQEGTTVFLIGHHERDKFVVYNERGVKSFEVAAEELRIIRQRKKINIFPFGCKTAFSKFREGANIDLNSYKLVENLLSELPYSHTFLGLLDKLAQYDAKLCFLVGPESFSVVSVETDPTIDRKVIVNYSFQAIDTSSTRLHEPARSTKVINGYFFTYLDTMPIFESETPSYENIPEPRNDLNSKDFKAKSKRRSESEWSRYLTGFFWIFVVILVYSTASFIFSKERDFPSNMLQVVALSFFSTIFLMLIGLLAKFLFG